jgi:hypothetical protein
MTSPQYGLAPHTTPDTSQPFVQQPVNHQRDISRARTSLVATRRFGTLRDSVRRFVRPAGNGQSEETWELPVAVHTVAVDLPVQTTLDQAIVALLKLRRGRVPGDATLQQSVALRFEHTVSEETTPAVRSQDITPEITLEE